MYTLIEKKGFVKYAAQYRMSSIVFLIALCKFSPLLTTFGVVTQVSFTKLVQ